MTKHSKANDKTETQPAGGYKSLRGIVPPRKTPADFKKLRQDFLKSLSTSK